jgi:hypothetical protein
MALDGPPLPAEPPSSDDLRKSGAKATAVNVAPSSGPESLSSEVPCPSRLDRLPYALYLAWVVVVAAAITLSFFAPRVFLWYGIDQNIPEFVTSPDLNRGLAAWEQVQDPFREDFKATNRPLRWRMLFPLLAHYLHFSRKAFFAIPFVGCIAALAVIAHVLARQTKNRWAALLGTTLAAGCSWFFTSTGWLSYNDSWIIAALTAVAGLRSRFVLVFCCAATPWIEERFLFVLPLALALRPFVFREARLIRDGLIDVIVAAVGAAPYLAVRLAAYWQGSDRATSGALFEAGQGNVNYAFVLEGAFMGLRGLGLFAAAFAWFAPQVRPKWFAVPTVLLAIGLFTLSLFIAGDLSRSASAFVPVGIVGLILSYRAAPIRCERILPWIVAINCLLPADHVVNSFRMNIYGAIDEINHLWYPPVPAANVVFYNSTGVRFLAYGLLDAAMEQFDMALRVDPTSNEVRFNRAFTLMMQKKYAAALQAAKEIPPTPTLTGRTLLIQATCYQGLGQPRYALQLYLDALAAEAPDWDQRVGAEAKIKALQSTGVTPARPR